MVGRVGRIVRLLRVARVSSSALPTWRGRLAGASPTRATGALSRVCGHTRVASTARGAEGLICYQINSSRCPSLPTRAEAHATSLLPDARWNGGEAHPGMCDRATPRTLSASSGSGGCGRRVRGTELGAGAKRRTCACRHKTCLRRSRSNHVEGGADAKTAREGRDTTYATSRRATSFACRPGCRTYASRGRTCVTPATPPATRHAASTTPHGHSRSSRPVGYALSSVYPTASAETGLSPTVLCCDTTIGIRYSLDCAVAGEDGEMRGAEVDEEMRARLEHTLNAGHVRLNLATDLADTSWLVFLPFDPSSSLPFLQIYLRGLSLLRCRVVRYNTVVHLWGCGVASESGQGGCGLSSELIVSADKVTLDMGRIEFTAAGLADAVNQ
ncbi:hypothetical protein FIBSPDRAFT_889719 [Athelia psychrophila]|uniref:Uncharacterized protein n=1 Tax=Athelia psychrophila TaxID=1759441 RepID=A0A166LUV3_9AGAM|nr:hypothetical protein FIBSPDRAFT_889719 [Fibularhizoctonia sp. CBS 109695]